MVNNKTLPVVLEEIQAPAEMAAKKKQRFTYYGIETYEQRLDSVVGKANYAVSYTEPQTIPLSATQVIQMARCMISFLDEAGNICYKAEGIGSTELTFSSENGSFINLSNAGYCLQAAAFKSACKSMDMFGVHAESGEHTENAAGNPADGKKQRLPEETGLFLTAGAFEIIRTEEKTGKPVYKVLANRIIGDRMQTSPVTVLFYPNQYKNSTDRLNGYVAHCSDGTRHKIQMKYSVSGRQSDAEENLVFKGFI